MSQDLNFLENRVTVFGYKGTESKCYKDVLQQTAPQKKFNLYENGNTIQGKHVQWKIRLHKFLIFYKQNLLFFRFSTKMLFFRCSSFTFWMASDLWLVSRSEKIMHNVENQMTLQRWQTEWRCSRNNLIIVILH